jgi:hypothetical protein
MDTATAKKRNKKKIWIAYGKYKTVASQKRVKITICHAPTYPNLANYRIFAK